MSIVQFSIRNGLIVNLLLVIIVIAGVLSWRSMPQEMFPIVDLDLVRIITEYEGAPPEEIEKQIRRCQLIRKGIQRHHSNTREWNEPEKANKYCKERRATINWPGLNWM